MATQERYFELYRRSRCVHALPSLSQLDLTHPRDSIGLALVESLDDLIKSGHLNPQLALKVLMQVRSLHQLQSELTDTGVSSTSRPRRFSLLL